MTEDEMLKDLAAADAAGQPELAQRIADTIRAQQANQPGLASRALNWMTTPSQNSQRHIDEKKAMADKAGPAPINRLLGVDEKDEPSLLTGAKAFLSGIPGYQADSTSHAADERMGRFRKEHPILGTALPLLGGMAKPVMLPATEAAYFPQPPIEAAKPAAAQTLISTGPMQGNLQAQMRSGAQTLSEMPNPPWDLLKTILGGAVGGHVIPGVGGAKGIPLAVAAKAAQKGGPRLGASALRGAAGAMDAIPQRAGTSALQLLQTLLEQQRQNRSEQQ